MERYILLKLKIMPLFIVLSLWILSCEQSRHTLVYPETPGELLNGNISDRTYLIELPRNYDSTKSYPLLLAFHGAGGTGLGMQSIAQFSSTTLGDQAIFVYPDAATDNWEEGCSCNAPWRLGIDDIGFMRALLDKIISERKIDTLRIYGVGFSQGGLFAQNVACKLDSRFAALASVAAAMSIPLSQTCPLPKATNLMVIHGMKDDVLPYDGDPSAGSFSLLSARQMLAFWQLQLGLSHTVVDKNIGNNVIKDALTDSKKAERIILYSISKGGHSWGFENWNTSQKVMEFLMAWRKPEPQ